MQCSALLPEDARQRAAGALVGAAAAATLLLPAMPALAVSGGGGKHGELHLIIMLPCLHACATSCCLQLS